MATEDVVARFIKELLSLNLFFNPPDKMAYIKSLESSTRSFSEQILIYTLEEIKETQKKYMPSIPEIIQIAQSNIVPPPGFIQNKRNQLIDEISNGLLDEVEMEQFISFLETHGKYFAAEEMKRRYLYYKDYFNSAEYKLIMKENLDNQSQESMISEMEVLEI